MKWVSVSGEEEEFIEIEHNNNKAINETAHDLQPLLLPLILGIITLEFPQTY